jgi:hypothetical protein
MAERYQNFAEFYPFYLSEHRNSACRRLHFVGSCCVLSILIYALGSGDYRWFLAAPIAGYGFAWLGHFAFEKNRPATFSYPWYSLLGDWVMFKDMLIRRIPF